MVKHIMLKSSHEQISRLIITKRAELKPNSLRSQLQIMLFCNKRFSHSGKSRVMKKAFSIGYSPRILYLFMHTLIFSKQFERWTISMTNIWRTKLFSCGNTHIILRAGTSKFEKNNRNASLKQRPALIRWGKKTIHQNFPMRIFSHTEARSSRKLCEPTSTNHRPKASLTLVYRNNTFLKM